MIYKYPRISSSHILCVGEFDFEKVLKHLISIWYKPFKHDGNAPLTCICFKILLFKCFNVMIEIVTLSVTPIFTYYFDVFVPLSCP